MTGFVDPSRAKRSPGLDPGVKPEVVEAAPKKAKQTRKVADDEDELPDLIAAK
jgi:hypothetical protein